MLWSKAIMTAVIDRIRVEGERKARGQCFHEIQICTPGLGSSDVAGRHDQADILVAAQ